MAGEYGEPWTWGTFVTKEQCERAMICVNALDGIADPAAFVEWVEKLEEVASDAARCGTNNDFACDLDDASKALALVLKEKPE